MTRTLIKTIVFSLCFVLVAHDAAAWGPKARRAIALAAMQLVRKDFPDVFKAGTLRYEGDVVKGAKQELSELGEWVPLNDEEQSTVAVSYEIQLLREVRKHGEGSHFASRMGLLSSLAAEVVLPFGVPFSETERQLKEKIDFDLDENIERYFSATKRKAFEYIRSTELYFRSHRPFYEDDKRMIEDDYARGLGYDGLLSQAGQTYFHRSVAAAADAWYSVLRSEGDAGDIPPSTRVVTWYYVGEIQYLLEKKNFPFAVRAYRVFDRVNPQLMGTYEHVGDAFYSYGRLNDDSRGIDRGVVEWKKAQRASGPQRLSVSKKLANHYLSVGEVLFRRSTTAEAEDTDLQGALQAFRTALEYERTNDIAKDRINETAVAIVRRQEDYELESSFIDLTDSIVKSAEESALRLQYLKAFDSYDKGLLMLGQITSRFKDLDKTATSNRDSIRKSIKALTVTVVNEATEKIESGHNALDQLRFEEAIRLYRSVPRILDPIPEDPRRGVPQNVKNLIDLSNKSITQAKFAEQAHQERLNAGETPAAGGAAAGGTQPAASAAPPARAGGARQGGRPGRPGPRGRPPVR